MIKFFRLYFSLVLMGFFLIPNVAQACEMNTKKSCCTTQDHSCCATHKESKQDKKNQKSCDNGKCNDTSCTCSTVVFGSSMFILTFEEIKTSDFYFNKKEKVSFFSKTFISSGFRSVWLPPKIG